MNQQPQTKRRLFGTDGIRGLANTEPMTADTALKVAKAAAKLFKRGDYRHRVVIGKDTRLSGYLFEPALTAGFISEGMDVILLGPLPTPAVAILTKSLRADLGVMISASHNPYHDNGIKLFGPDGYKLSDELEAQIESLMENGNNEEPVTGNNLGRASRLEDAVGRYVEYVKNTFPAGVRLDGMRIVVDCANGAAYKVAPTILWELGAEIIPLAIHPNGVNINKDCGAIAPRLMQEAVTLHQADVGMALDGDADRLIMANERGEIIDGDQLMALIASAWAKTGRLKENALVATVMSNLGLERFLSKEGIKLIRTQVGDRYVVEAMRAGGYNLGGEQSGHIILSDYSTTGDAMIAALQVLAIVKRQDQPVSTACKLFEPVPQILSNVKASTEVLEKPEVKNAISQAEVKLGKNGRILVRKSGTENLVRVMAEGDDADLVRDLVQEIVDIISRQAA